MSKRRNFEKFNKFMNETFPRASLAEKAIAECVWDSRQNEIDALKCLNRSYSKIIDDQDNALSAAPTPPEVEPIYQFKVIRSMIYWADCSKREYEGHSKYPDDYATRKLYASPPPPTASWDADGNPLNLEAAARDAVDYLSNTDNYPYSLEGLLHRRNNLRKFLPEGE